MRREILRESLRDLRDSAVRHFFKFHEKRTHKISTVDSQPSARRRFETESKATLEESIKTARLEAAASRTVEIISSFGLCAVVFFGAVKVLDGQLTPGDVLIFTAYLTSLYKPLRQLARLSSQFSKASVSAERISEILAAETETPDLPNAIPASHLQGAIAQAGSSNPEPGNQRGFLQPFQSNEF